LIDVALICLRVLEEICSNATTIISMTRLIAAARS
jgi:hypothetical protein